MQNQSFKDINKDIRFRKVNSKDIKELLKIYGYYVENTDATFEYEVPSLDKFTNRMKDICKEYPYIICEYKDKVVGYAYTQQFKPGNAYRWSAELTVYLHKDYLGLGIGTKFYELLIEILKLQNVMIMYGCVTSSNQRSIKLHEKMGFNLIGVYHNSGYKMGKWIDVTWFEQSIGAQDVEPGEFVNFNDLDQDLVL